ncbi:phage tail protein [Actinobacillus equuli subsp. haemolyticus]|uniref:phage tail-collar fiber domain-containing protein n=1 Tax=Actinobacillus equuli TaxID=718 RepID=UPI00241815C6|nr:phage tail protein [Actinobacillus equuli]MDG4948723.1 phage tail protein [Actinobacillus equuli subsp. haemolyticus]
MERQLFAQCIAQKKSVPFRTFAVGDGNGKAVKPDSTRTTLVKEKWRANISAISKDPRNNKQVIFELTIPENVGGFYVREMGLFDDQNRLVAYANCPESFKPQLAEGSGKVQVLRMVLLVSSSDAVTVTVDDSVIFVTRSQLTPKTIAAGTKNGFDETGHTHEIDKASTTKAGIAQLTNDINSTREDLALTALAGKNLSDKIDNVKVGGRNLLLNSAVAYSGNGYSTRYELAEAPALGEDVVITLYGNLGDDRTGIGVYNSQGYSAICDLKKIVDGIYQGKGVWKKPMNNGQEVAPNNTHLNVYFYPKTGTSTNTISKIKLERGTAGTDWSAAPEDKVSMTGNETIRGVKTFSQSLEASYRTVIRRNDGIKYAPYQMFIDESIDLSGTLDTAKTIGQVHFSAGETGRSEGRIRALISTGVDVNKNGYLEVGAYGNDNILRTGLKSFGDTGNVSIGKTTDNGNARLQVNGNVEATPPANNSNNRLLPTTDWVRTNTANLVDARTAYLGGSVAMQDCNPGQLPQGAFFGVAGKNLAGSAQNGFTFFTKPWHDNSGHFASVRFGVFGNKFYYQSAKNANEWLTPLELATVPYVDGRFNQLIGAAPAALDTLQELAQALKSNANVLDLYMLKADKSDAVNLDNSNKYATSKAVKTTYDKAVSADNNANNRVSKSGDRMTGDLEVPYLRVKRANAWINIISESNASSGIDFTNHNGKHAQSSIRSQDVGGYATELRFFNTPSGSNYETDRRQHVLTVSSDGGIWSKTYGWLHDVFMKRTDFSRNWYPNHYAGAEVYKIKHLGLMITVMNTNEAGKELTLPEAYDGHAICLAQDRGDGKISLAGSRFLGGNRIKLMGRSDTHCHVLVIGFKNVS